MNTDLATPEDAGLRIPVDHDNIISRIASGDWEDVLIILTKDMDPWDIDLIKLSKRFTGYIKKLHQMDLRIPAKILLTAAIIYRLKSETLNCKEEMDTEVPELPEEDFDMELDDCPLEKIVIPPIQIPLRRQPKRRVSIDELVNALDKAMVIKKRREAKEFFQIELNGEDISKSIENLYEQINTFLTTHKIINFSQLLVPRASKEETIRTFNSLLHLSNQGRVTCCQPELFGEIRIQVI